jgi:hypothetical protein
MKDLGPVDVILNIKLTKTEDGIILNQPHSAEKILSHVDFEDCKTSPTPYDANIKLQKFKGEGKVQLRHSQIIRSIIYLTSGTRLDISYVVSKLTWFTSNSGDDHWRALE